MKKTVIIAVVFVMLAAATASAMSRKLRKALRIKISVELKGMNLEKALEKVAKEAGIEIEVSGKAKTLIKKNSIKVKRNYKKKRLRSILIYLMELHNELMYKSDGDKVLILTRTELNPPKPADP